MAARTYIPYSSRRSYFIAYCRFVSSLSTILRYDLLLICRSMLAMPQAALCFKHCVWDTPSQSSDLCLLVTCVVRHVLSLKERRYVTELLWACIQSQRANNATAGVNLMLMNGLPIDVSSGTELYPLLERISAEVSLP